MSDREIRVLGGKKFDVVEQGLDEGQVAEFFSELVRQRDTLLEQINSLLSYIRVSKDMVGKGDEPAGSSGQQAEDGLAEIAIEAEQGIQPAMETAELEQMAQTALSEASTAMEAVKEDPALYQGEQAEDRPAGIAIEAEQGIHPAMETTEIEQMAQTALPEASTAMEAVKEDPALYQGELELAVLPPVNAVGLLQFERKLRNSFQLKILSTDGSPSKGGLITVLVSEPQPLLQNLKQIPEVNEVGEELDISAQEKGIPPLFKNKQGKRIWVTLNVQAN